MKYSWALEQFVYDYFCTSLLKMKRLHFTDSHLDNYQYLRKIRKYYDINRPERL